MSNPAVAKVVTVPVAAIRANPLVWLIFFAVIAAVVIRYRVTISAWLSGAPLVGERTRAFMR